MGRRALQKVDPNLDLSEHYFEFEQLTAPLSASPLFPQAPDRSPDSLRPLEIEIGSGKGLFLEAATGEHPDRYFLGIEIARKYARYSAARLLRQQRVNGAVVGGDAQLLFEKFVPDASVAAVHVYFPDPWWKRRHRKRRIMNPQFLKEVHRTLEPGGSLHFWTDVEEYFRSSLKLLARLKLFDGPFAVEEAQPEDPMDYRTHFERRMRMHDVPIHRSRFVKPSAA